MISSRIGAYEIVSRLGEGGMGAVYRARDTKLNRDVALKVLLPEVANDPERLARFRREAQVLASLNHPHIGTIHGLEEGQANQAGTIALVLELVEGPTLADRIAQGPIPLDEALPIAKQIAEALEAAHEQGIVHRDLKPANIKVRDDGTVKVLDFGLAKAIEGAGGPGRVGEAGRDLTNSPTITSPALMTGVGMILGTAAYMAPEQARGKVVDKRADIWAFGVVLYEMLAGRSVFAAEDVSLTLAEVMKSDPDWTRLPAGTPPALRQLLIRCLQKERRLRLRDIGDARLALDDVSQSSDVNVGTTVLHARPASRVWIAAFAAAAALAVALAIPALRHASEATPAAPPEVRTEIVTPATADPVSFALSPDGRQIVFVATGDGASRLWLRTLSETGAQPLAGTEGAMQPFWSPDGKSIGFFDDNELKRLDLGAGLPRVLAPVNSSRGGAWNRDGVILVAPVARGIARVPATGGDVIPVTTLDGQSSHRFPAFLPDGRHFLFYATGGLDVRGIYLGTLDGGTVTRLTEGYSSAGAFLPDGYGPSPSDDRGGWLLWSRNDSLVARRLDVNRRALAGDEMPVADSVREGRGADATRAFSVSEAGLIAYRTGVIEKTQVAWFDRAGKVLQPLDTTGTATSPRISPDGRRVAVARENAQGTDLWLLDGTRETRFTFTPGSDNWPIWAGGERIIFNSNRMGMYNAYTKPTSGASAEELLFKSDTQTIVHDVSRDGRFLLYGSGGSMWVTPLTESSAAQKLVSSPSGAGWGRFSPDGRWIASQSNESGRNEIYVRPFVIPPTGSATAATGAQWQVSTEGGIHARWRPDGRELYWIAPDGSLVAATVAAGSTMFEAGTPTVLFQTRITRGGTDNGQGPQYDVSADGRFLINVELAGEAAAPITLLQNWRPPTR